MTRDPHRDQPVLTAGRKLSEAAGAIILVHGRGGSAEDILQLRNELDYPELAYVAPQAAENTWYPYSFLAPIEQNEPWLTSALNKLKNTVGNITREGIPQDKIVIAGFSQGACLASEFVARNAANCGGLIAFTGGLIGPPGTDFHNTGSLSGTPVFLGAGDPDAHVPWQRVRESADALSALGADVLLRCYPGMPHTISRQELEEARRLLDRTFSPDSQDRRDFRLSRGSAPIAALEKRVS
jgi:predicted esterase